MSLLHSEIQEYFYNVNSLSIKDFRSDIVIADAKWDFIFKFISKNTESFYFLGEKLEYFDKELNSLINDLAETQINLCNDLHKIFIKLNARNVILNRKRLSDLWNYYEYPAIIFLGKNKDENELTLLCKRALTYIEIVGSMNGTYVLHRNFEPNVLWLKKSLDTPDIQHLFSE